MRLGTILLLASIFIFASCQNKKSDSTLKSNIYSFYLGTYTDGDSKGIYRLEMDTTGRMKMLGLAAETKNPSFLAFANSGKTLLSVGELSNENKMGAVESYQIGDSLKLISRKSSGGAHPCFVAANSKGIVLAANYSGGNIGYLKVNEKGELTDLLDVQQHTGSGTNLKRQNKAHAHSVWFQPNSDQIVAVDLGTNELWLSSINRESNKFESSNNPRIALADGAGPRHMTFHPNEKYAFVLNELNNTITSFDISNQDEWKNLASVTTLPKDFKEFSKSADIHISSDGKFIYASNRGHNSIAIFKVQSKAQLKLVGIESTRGDHPRNFSLSPDDKFLLVANQNTNNIVCFKRDKETGLLTFVDEIAAPKPVCILFEK